MTGAAESATVRCQSCAFLPGISKTAGCLEKLQGKLILMPSCISGAA